MAQRSETYGAFREEVRRLEPAMDAQVEAMRLFPRWSIEQGSVEVDVVAQCAFIGRLLERAREAAARTDTATAPPSIQNASQSSNDEA
jgi:hypothetical protein